MSTGTRKLFTIRRRSALTARRTKPKRSSASVMTEMQNGLSFRLIALQGWPGVTQVVEGIEVFLRNQGQELVAQLEPFFQFLVAWTQDDIPSERIAPDQHFVAFKAEFRRQAHCLAAAVLEQLGGLHGAAPFGWYIP